MNYVAIVFGALLIDQVTKRLFQSIYSYTLSDNLEFQLTWNKGVGFSILSNLGNVPLILITSIITVYIAYLFKKAVNFYEKTGLALILGGALGNLLDRIMFDGVCDFIVLKNSYYQFPTFNIADFAITIGGFLVLIKNMFRLK